MKGKAMLVVGAGIGYLLGSRAGRQPYEQIRDGAERLWQDPRVQDKAARAQDLAREKAPKLHEKVTQTAKRSSGPG
jgi:oxygen-dependent protoporphyrinogen oxidase